MAACSTEKKYDQRYTFRMDILKAIKAMVCKTELLEVKNKNKKNKKKTTTTKLSGRHCNGLEEEV